MARPKSAAKTAAAEKLVAPSPEKLRADAKEIEALQAETTAKAQEMRANTAVARQMLTKEVELSGRVAPVSTTVPSRAALSEVLADIAEAFSNNAKRMQGTRGLPSAKDFCERLQAAFKSSQGRYIIDFSALGREVSGVMFDAPAFRPFLGTMTLPLKEAKAKLAKEKVVRLKDTGVMDRPDEGMDDAPAEARNSKRTFQIFGALKQHYLNKSNMVHNVECDDHKVRPMISLIAGLFDPFSYSQTVENLFYFSFLVKQHLAAIHLGKEDGLPYIWVNCNSTGQGTEDADGDGDAPAAGAGSKPSKKAGLVFQARQFVLQLDPDSWRRVCQKHELAAPLLPHRKSADSTAGDSYAFHTDDEPVSGKKRPNAAAVVDSNAKKARR